jgi:HEAT repeat protein
MFMRYTKCLLCACVIPVLVLTPARAQTAADPAVEYLKTALNNPNSAPYAMAMLASTQDTALLDVFEALAKSRDKETRLYAVGVLEPLAGELAVPILRDRLNKDPRMAVRVEALAQLIALEAITDAQLTDVLAIDDDSMRLLAAQTLAQRGQGAAIPALRGLVEQSDPDMAAAARLSLLKFGDLSQLDPLRDYFAGLESGKVPPIVGQMLLGQIATSEIVSAEPIVREILAMDLTAEFNAQCWWVLSNLSPESGSGISQELVDRINGNSFTRQRVQLLRILADRSDAPRHCQALSADDDEIIATLARFEVVRPERSESTGKVARQAIALEHPIVVSYVLGRIGEDLVAEQSDMEVYVPALIDYLAIVARGPDAMGPEHMRAAQAATMLADIGTDEAMDALNGHLVGPYGPTARAVGAGLMRSDNPAVCDLMTPLLESPYNELATDAALTLGRFGRTEAAPALSRIVAAPDSHQPALVAVASWYLITATGQTTPAVMEISQSIK